jgi:flagellar hook protein FlgE
MYAGVSGLNAEGQALGVVGDNIANSNTVGFKMSRALFEDVLGGAVGQNMGGGVRMARTQQLFAQGALLNTGQPTDIALSGEGFFVVKGTLDGITGDFYTRAGQTTLNAEGYLVNPQGLKIQGYVANPDGTFQASLSDVQIPTTPLPPKTTENIEIDGKLDSGATPPALPFDPTNPAQTSNSSTSTTVYDSLGTPHEANVYFVNTGPGTWDYHVLVDGGEVNGGTAGTPFEIGAGNLTFDTNGNLTSPVAPPQMSVDFINATPGQVVTMDLGTAGTMDGLSQTDGASFFTKIEQDGYGPGAFSGIQIDGEGVVNGIYSNGEQIPLAQLGVAKFASNDGLARAGHNVWMETRQSGEAVVGTAGAGGRGGVVAGAIEQSNVDIAGQFVALIAHQRSFQANSKTITTADEMLQEITNLKR